MLRKIGPTQDSFKVNTPHEHNCQIAHRDLRQYLQSLGILDESGWLQEGITLPDLPIIDPRGRNQLNDLLKQPISVVAGRVRKQYTLKELLLLLANGKRRGKIQLVGSDLKRILGSSWFANAIETLIKKNAKVSPKIDFEDTSLTERSDIDCRFVIEDGSPSNVAACDFLQSLVLEQSEGQAQDLLPALEEEFKYGYFSKNNSVLLRKDTVDLYICQTGGAHTTLTHEDLILDITLFLSDENALLQPQGDIKKGWQAVIAHFLQLIQVTEINRSTWSRVMIKRFKGFNLSTPLPQELYQGMVAERLIKQTQSYFETKILYPKEQFQFLLFATADLMAQRIAPEIVSGYFYTLKAYINPVPDDLTKIADLFVASPIDLTISILRIESEKSPFLQKSLSPISLECAIETLASYDATQNFPLKMLFSHFNLEQQNSLEAADQLPFILVQKFAPSELGRLSLYYSQRNSITYPFFASAIALLLQKGFTIHAAQFLTENIHKVRITSSDISQLFSEITLKLLAPQDETSMMTAVRYYLKMMSACLKKNDRMKREMVESLKHNFSLLMRNNAPIPALELLAYSANDEELILRDPALWLNALQAYGSSSHTDWHVVFKYWQVAQKCDLFGNMRLPGNYVPLFSSFLTELFKGTPEEADTAFILFEKIGRELLSRATKQEAKALTLSKKRREASIARGIDTAFSLMEKLIAKKIQPDEFCQLIDIIKAPLRKDQSWEKVNNQFTRACIDYFALPNSSAAILQKSVLELATSEKSLRFQTLMIECIKLGPLSNEAGTMLLVWLIEYTGRSHSLNEALCHCQNDLISALLRVENGHRFLQGLHVLNALNLRLDKYAPEILNILINLYKRFPKYSTDRNEAVKQLIVIISKQPLNQKQFAAVLKFAETLIIDRQFEDGVNLLYSLIPGCSPVQLTETVARSLSLLDGSNEHQKAIWLIEQMHLHFPAENETISKIFGALSEAFYLFSAAKTAEFAPLYINQERNQRVFARMVQSDFKGVKQFLVRGFVPEINILNKLLQDALCHTDSELRTVVWAAARRHFNPILSEPTDSFRSIENLQIFALSKDLLISLKPKELSTVALELDKSIDSIAHIDESLYKRFSSAYQFAYFSDYCSLVDTRISIKNAPSDGILRNILLGRRLIVKLDRRNIHSPEWERTENKLVEILSKSATSDLFFKGWKLFERFPYPSKTDGHTKDIYLSFLNGSKKFINVDNPVKTSHLVRTITERVYQRRQGFSLSEEDFKAMAHSLSKHPIFKDLLNRAAPAERLLFLDIKNLIQKLTENEDKEYRQLLWKEFFHSIGRLIAPKSVMMYLILLMPLLSLIKEHMPIWTFRMIVFLLAFSVTLHRKDVIAFFIAFISSVYVAYLKNKVLQAET